MATGGKSVKSTPKSSGRKAAAPDALALLRQDHKTVSELFDKYENAKAQSRKKSIATQICNELKVHAQIEEEIFYPELRAATSGDDADDMLDEADVEHAGAKRLIAEIDAANPGDDHYDAKVKVLSEYIRHHVKEEQNEIFPLARKSALDLKQLGTRLAARKRELKRAIG